MESLTKSFIFFIFLIALMTYAIPLHVAIASETPTETPTGTPTPKLPLPDRFNITLDANHELKRLVRDMSPDACLAIQAETGDLYCMDRANDDRVEIHKIYPFQIDLVRSEMKTGFRRSFSINTARTLSDLAVDWDETLYAMCGAEGVNWIYEILRGSSWFNSISVAYSQKMLLVDSDDLISGANSTDLLLIYIYGTCRIFRYDVKENRQITTLIESDEFVQSYISDLIIGPNNSLCFLVHDKNQSILIYKYEENNVKELIHGAILPGYIPHKFAYLEKEKSFYIVAENSENELSLFRVTGDGLSAVKVGDLGAVHSMVSSKDGRSLYFTNPLSDNKSAIYAYTYTDAEVTPTPSFTPTNTPIPSCTPTNTLTPSITPTFTPTPTFAPLFASDDRFDSEILVHHLGDYVDLFVHPITGNLVFQYEYLSRKIYSLAPTDRIVDLSQIEPSLEFKDSIDFRLHAVHPDGWFYGVQSTAFMNFMVQRVPDNGFLDTSFSSFEAKPRALHIVCESDTIPDAEPGDVLILGEKDEHRIAWIWNLDPYELINISAPCDDPTLPCETPLYVPEVVPLMPDEDIPICPQDWTIGPDGALYLLVYDLGLINTSKVYRLGMDKKFKEAFHFSLGEGYYDITYCPAARSFFFLNNSPRSLVRISEDGSEIKKMEYSDGFIYDIATSLDGTAVYLSYKDYPISERNSIEVLRYKGEVSTPTPIPSEPTPIPTPIPGWFVLDGFGGVHSSNPEIERPVLPYFAPYNIVRDIEPDPLGRGWYMLDGLGGIHTSSPDLPRPMTLPYFNFDIARNLEIVLTDHGLEFYMLDGFGTIHTSTGEPFEYGDLPWLGADLARELEPDPKGEGWLMLDGYGIMYSTHRSEHDFPLSASFHSNPVARGMVRFPDETTVLIDAFGGRHTNPFYPAVDVINGLPPEFYFYGFDIIWDVETVPAAQ